MKIINKQNKTGNQSAGAGTSDTRDIPSRRFEISNEALSKLYTCRAMADIICFEKDMPDSLDEHTLGTLKFQLWEMIGEVTDLIDCAEFKS